MNIEELLSKIYALFEIERNTENLCEIPDNFADPIEKSPNVIIFSIFPDMDPLGYKVPLIKVGALY